MKNRLQNIPCPTNIVVEFEPMPEELAICPDILSKNSEVTMQDNQNLKKYCAYLRKSRSDRDAELRGEEETLKRHRRILSEFAEKNNIQIAKWYCEVVSGDTIADRPVVQSLLSDVEVGKWDGVLVVEVERLARGNTKDQGTVSDAFKYSGTKIITPMKTYDPNNEFDEEYFEFGLFMSRREYKTITRRLQRGRIASVKEGKFVCSTAPYGYRKIKIPHDKGYTLEVIPEEADIVRKIFEWYCHGELMPDGIYHKLGTESIAARLDTLGVKPTRNASWSKATISDMLRNKIYAGYVFFGRQKEVKSSVDGIIRKTRKNDPDYLCVKGLHPAIIDEETFRLAESVRSENRKYTTPSSQMLQNPLSGIVYCKKCGHMMTRLAPNSRNKYSTLKCPNRYCNNVSSPIFLVEEQILQFLRDWLVSYDLNTDSAADFPIHKEISSKQDMICRMESEIAGLHSQLEKVYNFLEQGVYTVEIFQNRSAVLNKNIEQLNDSIRQTQEELERLEFLRVEKESYAPKVRFLLDNYGTNSVESNNRILKEVIEKVYYEKTAPNRRGGLYNANFTLSIFPNIPK